MYSYKRMNQHEDTASKLIKAGRELFPRKGYEGCSVRDLAHQADANLGAVTYHFGSKAALYDAVVASFAEPFRARIAEAAQPPGAPLDRIEGVVRTFFAHLREEAQLPRLILQQLASDRPMPESAKRTLQANHGTLASLIQAGQADGSIRPGDARVMAINIAAQPMFMMILRPVLQEAVAINQTDPGQWSQLVEHAVAFVRGGLAAGEGERP